MRKQIIICDICGKETNDCTEHHTRKDVRTGANRVLDICSDCEKLFHLFATATPEKIERVAEILNN